MQRREKVIVNFSVLGKIKGKERPRFNAYTRRTYTPLKTKNYEEQIKNGYIISVGNKMLFKPKEPVGIEIIACFKIPKSARKKDVRLMLDKTIKPTKKPDVDNIAKVVCDALNKLAYQDDAQIAEINVKKIYSTQEKLDIALYPLEQ